MRLPFAKIAVIGVLVLLGGIVSLAVSMDVVSSVPFQAPAPAMP
jgi:hypothetical protein